MESTDEAHSEPSSSPVNSPDISVPDSYSSSFFSSFGSYYLCSGGSSASDDERSFSDADKTELTFIPGTQTQRDTADSSSEEG